MFYVGSAGKVAIGQAYPINVSIYLSKYIIFLQ